MTKKRRFVFFVPYAYDYVLPRTSGGTTERCAQALHFASEELSSDVESIRYAILTAGYSKESPRDATENHPVSLAAQQSNYLNSLGDTSRHLIDPCGWGTFDETFHSIRIIKRILRMYSKEDSEIHVVVSSNPFHLFGRVALCWRFMKPDDWKIHFVEAHHRYTWKERFQEIFLKIPNYVWRLFVKKEHLTAVS